MFQGSFKFSRFKKSYNLIFRLLLKVGTPTYVKANNLDTPLHDAVTKGGLEIIELLLKAGADAHAMNE